MAEKHSCEESGQIESLLDLKAIQNSTEQKQSEPVRACPSSAKPCKAFSVSLQIGTCRLQLDKGAKSACRFGRAGAQAARSAPAADGRSPRRQMAHSDKCEVRSDRWRVRWHRMKQQRTRPGSKSTP